MRFDHNNSGAGLLLALSIRVNVLPACNLSPTAKKSKSTSGEAGHEQVYSGTPAPRAWNSHLPVRGRRSASTRRRISNSCGAGSIWRITGVGNEKFVPDVTT